jgi:SF3a60/Prp9 C-terminal
VFVVEYLLCVGTVPLRLKFRLPAVDRQAVNEDSEEEDDFIYNPLKLPMGWDGKPIPYWLYKLHGLNQVRLSPGLLEPEAP